MYNTMTMQDEIFEGLLTVALTEYMKREDTDTPSDEELAKKYPIKPKMLKKYQRIVKAREYKMPLTLVYLRRAAVILLAVISLTFGVLMTNADVRAAIINSVVEHFDKYATIDFGDDSPSASTYTKAAQKAIESLTIGYIPENFTLSEAYEEPNRKYFYLSDSGESLSISITSAKLSTVSVDTEYSIMEQLTINGNDAYLSYNETKQTGSLVFGNDIYIVNITGMTEKEELIKIAENIK